MRNGMTPKEAGEYIANQQTAMQNKLVVEGEITGCDDCNFTLDWLSVTDKIKSFFESPDIRSWGKVRITIERLE